MPWRSRYTEAAWELPRFEEIACPPQVETRNDLLRIEARDKVTRYEAQVLRRIEVHECRSYTGDPEDHPLHTGIVEASSCIGVLVEMSRTEVHEGRIEAHENLMRHPSPGQHGDDG